MAEYFGVHLLMCTWTCGVSGPPFTHLSEATALALGQLLRTSSAHSSLSPAGWTRKGYCLSQAHQLYDHPNT